MSGWKTGLNCKVPAPGQAVNDGGSQRLSVSPGLWEQCGAVAGGQALAGPVASGRAGIFARDSVKIPTYPRLFSVYRRGATHIMMAGTRLAHSRNDLLRNTGWLPWIRLVWQNTQEPPELCSRRSSWSL